MISTDYDIAFCAPERLQGIADPGERGDVFSLGAILYWVTVGQFPFEGEAPGSMIHAIVSGRAIPRPSSLVPGYPPVLEAILDRAMATNPANRYANGEEFAAALEAFLDGAGLSVGAEEIGGLVRSLLGDRA